VTQEFNAEALKHAALKGKAHDQVPEPDAATKRTGARRRPDLTAA
jgi:hypothetical protein